MYTERSAQQAASVLRGRILQAREVLVQPSDSARYAEGAAGAALGGGAGAWLGRNSRGAQAVLGIAGAAFAGVAGSKASESLGAGRAIEYIVQAKATASIRATGSSRSCSPSRGSCSARATRYF
jgi:outer membrane lipoprotein SlyB